jgi:hypothetical protein
LAHRVRTVDASLQRQCTSATATRLLSEIDAILGGDDDDDDDDNDDDSDSDVSAAGEHDVDDKDDDNDDVIGVAGLGMSRAEMLAWQLSVDERSMKLGTCTLPASIVVTLLCRFFCFFCAYT